MCDYICPIILCTLTPGFWVIGLRCRRLLNVQKSLLFHCLLQQSHTQHAMAHTHTYAYTLHHNRTQRAVLCVCVHARYWRIHWDFRKEEIEAAASCLTHNLKQIHTVILCSCLCKFFTMENVHSFHWLPSETDTHKHTVGHAHLAYIIYCFQFNCSDNDKYSVEATIIG